MECHSRPEPNLLEEDEEDPDPVINSKFGFFRLFFFSRGIKSAAVAAAASKCAVNEALNLAFFMISFLSSLSIFQRQQNIDNIDIIKIELSKILLLRLKSKNIRKLSDTFVNSPDTEANRSKGQYNSGYIICRNLILGQFPNYRVSKSYCN